MAKISFNKLGLKKKEDIVPLVFENDVTVEVKQYLPIEDKLKMLSSIINKSTDNSPFYNPGQLSVFFKLEMVEYYTNINFTEKQKEDFTKTYDLLESNGMIKVIFDAIPKDEIDKLESWLVESVQAIYQYNQSAYGILNAIKAEYNNMNLDIEGLQKKIKDPESLDILKQVAPMLDLA